MSTCGHECFIKKRDYFIREYIFQVMDFEGREKLLCRGLQQRLNSDYLAHGFLEADRPKKRSTVIHQTICRVVEWDVMCICKCVCNIIYIFINFIKSSVRNALTPTNPGHLVFHLKEPRQWKCCHPLHNLAQSTLSRNLP